MDLRESKSNIDQLIKKWAPLLDSSPTDTHNAVILESPKFTPIQDSSMANQHIKPIGHRILVQLIEQKEQMFDGIVVPDTIHKELPNSAKVIEVGDGYVGETGRIPLPININVGDTLLLVKNCGIEVKLNEVKYRLITPEDVLAIQY